MEPELASDVTLVGGAGRQVAASCENNTGGARLRHDPSPKDAKSPSSVRRSRMSDARTRSFEMPGPARDPAANTTFGRDVTAVRAKADVVGGGQHHRRSTTTSDDAPHDRVIPNDPQGGCRDRVLGLCRDDGDMCGASSLVVVLLL